MSTHHDAHHSDHGHGGGHHAPPSTFLSKYVFSTDHKVIALQFLFSGLFFVILGALFALGVRYQIAWPNQHVPYKWLMPNKMTAVAPEQNIALWKVGGKVTLNEAVGSAEARAVATLEGFPQGYAVRIPAYTIIETESGHAQTLSEEWLGFVAAGDVMGDYDYAQTRARAIAGTTVRVGDPGAARQVRILGRELLTPDATGRPTKLISHDPVLLALRPEATPVKIKLSGQTLDGATASQLTFVKDALTSDAYLQLFTMHASIMIFFVIIPTLVGFFGNFCIPLMIGARDMAFPKLNMLAFWLSSPAGLLMIISFWTIGGPAGGGWTMYPTLSHLSFSQQFGTTLWIISVALVGFGSVVGALNYMTTIINMRAPGMSMFRMPLTVWSLFITSMLALLGTPVLTAAMVLLILDRTVGTMFFVPQGGGQVLLFQHLFWFYSHPAVYIMILPAMGVTSDVLATFCRKPIFGYKPMVFAMGAITGLGFIVWGHHMFQSGMNPVLGTTFMASTIMIAVPSAIKTFNWLGTIWGGNVRFTPAMLNALGFVSMFVIGGLSGIFMASTPIDIHIHDTYFIVAHIHYVLFGGSIFGIFAGIYYWFPKMFGRQMNQKWGVIHFVLTFIAFNGTFFLMHILGVGGHPRRYASIMEYPTLQHLQPMNVFMTLWAISLGAAQLPFFYNIFVSLPRKLGRAMTAVFTFLLGAPMVAGLVYWSQSEGAARMGLGWIERLIAGEGVAGYSGLGQWGGYLFALGALVALFILMLRTLPSIGKPYAFFFMGGFVLYAFAVAIKGGGGKLALPEVHRDDTPLMHTIHLLHEIFWSPITHDVLIACGWSVVFGLAVTAAVWGIWALGAALRVPAILQRLMYVAIIPLWLSPFVLKHDMFLWLGVPGMFAYKWLLLALLAVPGAVYLLVVRPRDEFGYAVDPNPWHANSLEWQTTSPPPYHNFDEIPTVYRGPYEYSSPVVSEDYLPQPQVLPAGVVEPSGH